LNFAFRYGGDEFVLLLPQIPRENAINVARRLHKLIREPIWLQSGGHEHPADAQPGDWRVPADSKSKEGLLHWRTRPMYLVKIRIATGRRGQYGHLRSKVRLPVRPRAEFRRFAARLYTPEILIN